MHAQGLLVATLRLVTVTSFIVLGYYLSETVKRWNGNRGRDIVLLGFIILLAVVLRLFRRVPQLVSTRGLGIIGVLLVATLSVWHVAILLQSFERPRPVDIPRQTLAAGQALLRGANPYQLRLDPKEEMPAASDTYSGFAYMPLMAVVYLPFGSWLGMHGVLITNLILEIVAGGALWLLVRRSVHAAAAWWAVAILLAVPVVPHELYTSASTDIAAVVPLLVALWFPSGSRWRGFWIGISIATKLMPGAIFALAFFPRQTWQRYTTGLLLGLLPCLVFLVLSPVDTFSNTVLWSFVRPINITSWQYDLPIAYRIIPRLLSVALLVATSFYVLRSRFEERSRLLLATLLTMAAILLGPTHHGNYELWWLPLYVVVLIQVVAAGNAQGETQRS